MRLPRTLLVAASISIATAAQGVPTPAASASAPAAAPGLGIQLLDAPLSGNNDPRAHLYIVDQLKAGTTITRHVRISNSTGAVAHVSMYAAAASVSGGEFHFGAGKAPSDLTSWTSVSPATSSVAAGATAIATVRIAVPRHVTSGERYGVVWAQLSSPPGVDGVREINRVGVRVYLEIAGDEQPSDFSITSIAAGRDETGRPMVTARVHNTGHRAVDVAGTAGLSRGPGGLRTDPAPTDRAATIAPGDTQNVSASFDPRLLAGPWLVTVLLASGTLHHRATATVTFPAGAAAPVVVPVRHAGHSTAWMWWAVALLVVGVAGWWLMRRRRTALSASSR